MLTSRTTRLAAVASICLAATATLSVANSATVVPQATGQGPVGVLLEGEYNRYSDRNLFGSPVSGEPAEHGLLREYIKLTSAKDRTGLETLYLPDDGSRDRAAVFLPEMSTLSPGFRLLGASILEGLRWDGLSIDVVAMQGSPALVPDMAPLMSVCPRSSRCYLLSPGYGADDPEFELLGTVVGLFSKHSTPATAVQVQTFMAKNPLTVRLTTGVTYANLTNRPVNVKVNVEPYANVPVTEATGEMPAAYSTRPELSALFELLQQLGRLEEDDIADDNAGFRSEISRAFNASYAADVLYTVNQGSSGAYALQMVSAADFVKAIRSWDEVEPICSVRHADTTFVYVQARREGGDRALQLFPVKIVGDRGEFEAVKFANYVGSLMQSPQVLEAVEESCTAVDTAAAGVKRFE